MKTATKLEQEFCRQVGLLRGLGQFAMLRLVVQHFQQHPEQSRPAAVWPPADVEYRKET
jgi:hypothetical protein